MPTEEQMVSFLSGNGITVAADFVGGFNYIISPGNGYSSGVGIVTPQIGANYSYTPKVLIFESDVRW